MYLNIKIKEDFRTLKKDSEYKFDFATSEVLQAEAEVETDF